MARTNQPRVGQRVRFHNPMPPNVQCGFTSHMGHLLGALATVCAEDDARCGTRTDYDYFVPLIFDVSEYNNGHWAISTEMFTVISNCMEGEEVSS